MAPDTRLDTASAALAAATLDQSRPLDWLSLALFVLALAGLLAGSGGWPGGLLAASLAAGVVQRYFAFRCGIDAHLFAHWSACWSGQPAPDPQADLGAFDTALAPVFGMRRPSAEAPRPLAARIDGALRLLRRQAIALAIQLAAILGAILVRLIQTGTV